MTVNGSGSTLGMAVPLAIDTTTANPARRYNYWLGGRDNFAADRASGDAIAAAFPTIRTAATENRRYLQRVVTYLAGECGIRQFLDIGTGLPAEPYLHDIAAHYRPDMRVLYVDNDEMVAAWSRAWLTRAQPPATSKFLHADVRHPDTITGADELASFFDLDQPIGLLMIAVLHFLADTDQPAAIVAELAAALAPGSYVALSHATLDPLPEEVSANVTGLADPAGGNGAFHPRTRHQVCELLAGLDLVEPGLVSIVDWRPDLPPGPEAGVDDVACFGAVARLS